MKKAPNYQIDYFSHPGFKFNIKPKSIPDVDIIFDKIDKGLEQINMLQNDGSEKLKFYYKENISPLFDGLRSIVKRELLNVEYSDCISKELTNMEKFLYDEIVDAQSRDTSLVKTMSGATHNVYHKLKSEGVFTVKINNREIKKLNYLLGNYKKVLEDKAVKSPLMLCADALKCDGEYWNSAVSILQKNNIVDAVSAYMGYPMHPFYFSLQLSHEKECWYENCYEDVGLPTSKATYMHYDHAYDNIKVIIYLNEVDLDTGPFSIVKYSPDWLYSKSRDAFAKYLDIANYQYVKLKDKISGPYYRQFFKYADCRKEFLQLPVELQASSHFGDDVLDNSTLSKELLRNEIPFLSKDANCIVFAGWKYIHRGGQVNKDKRWCIQIGFSKNKPEIIAAPSKKITLKESIKRNIYYYLPDNAQEKLKKLYRKVRSN